MTRITIYLDIELRRCLELESARRQMPVAEILSEVVREKFHAKWPIRSPHGGRFSSGRSDIAKQSEELLQRRP